MPGTVAETDPTVAGPAAAAPAAAAGPIRGRAARPGPWLASDFVTLANSARTQFDSVGRLVTWAAGPSPAVVVPVAAAAAGPHTVAPWLRTSPSQA